MELSGLMRNSYFVIAVLLLGCNGNASKEIVTEPVLKNVNVPSFNSDSAYSFVKKQVDFGPRVPNSEPHKATGDYIVTQLKSYGAEVTVQEFQQTSFDGVTLNLRNIIGSFSPEKTRRVLLAAHWDTRPFADKDTVNVNLPIDGANDGASGVGVLLEIARVVSNNTPPEVGLDFIFFDGEDWGENLQGPSRSLEGGLKSWYCLGSQYWAKNKHKRGYSAYYGILLDMVGAKGSKFFKEGTSMRMAPTIVNKVWQTASQLGYSNYFVSEQRSAITDDHEFMNEAGIPSIDIVHYDPQYGYFGDYHHTHRDNLDLIDKEVLGVVGNTLLHVIYYEPGAPAL